MAMPSSVVAVGSLSNQLSSAKRIDRDLALFYRRPPFEPENRVTGFDRMRLHYVAFSRPQKMLVLMAHTPPKDHFAPIWQVLPQWPVHREKPACCPELRAARADAGQAVV